MNAKRTINTNAKKGDVKTVKPYCKVCHDAGKSEKEYTSHFVKNNPTPTGVIVCPTLLAQLCRYCQGKGHTTSYCPELKTKKSVEEKKIKQKEYAEKEGAMTSKNQKIKPQKNSFSTLFEDEDEADGEPEEKLDTKEKDEFPALPAKITKQAQAQAQVQLQEVKTKTVFSYADIAMKAKELPEQKKKLEIVIPEKPILVRAEPIFVELKRRPNWGDYSESDDEDEDEYGNTFDLKEEFAEYDETW